MKGESDEHGESALTVANIVHFLTSNPDNVFESCKKVVFGHLVKRKVPKIERTWTQMFVTVSISSAVTDPDVITSIC